MLFSIAKIILLLIWFGVMGGGFYFILQKETIKGLWLIVCGIFGVLAVVLGFFPERILVGGFFTGIALCLLALGENFLPNIYYAVTAPTYSLRIMSKEDSFSFSILLVFLGGLFIGLYAAFLDPAIQSAYTTFSNNLVDTILAAYPNPTYKDIIFQAGVERMHNYFEAIYTNNIVWFPVAWVAIWFIVGGLYWFMARLFGSPSTYKELLSSLAYYYVLYGVIAGYFMLHAAVSSLSASPGQVAVNAVDAIGSLVMLVGLIYFLICVAQGAEIGIAQTIISFIVISAVLGGIGAALWMYKFSPTFQAFASELQSADPSRI